MSKYRIKEIIYENGTKRYALQKKFLFWYNTLSFMCGDYLHNIHTFTHISRIVKKSEIFNSKDQFKDIIDWLEKGSNYTIGFDKGIILYLYPVDGYQYTYYASTDKQDVLDMIPTNDEDTQTVKEINYFNI